MEILIIIYRIKMFFFKKNIQKFLCTRFENSISFLRKILAVISNFIVFTMQKSILPLNLNPIKNCNKNENRYDKNNFV